MKADVYTRVTDKIVADLEKGIRTWLKPWNAEHAAGRPGLGRIRMNRGGLGRYHDISVPRRHYHKREKRNTPERCSQKRV